MPQPGALVLYFPLALLAYTPISYYTDRWMYRRRQRGKAKRGGRKGGTADAAPAAVGGEGAVAMSGPDVRAFTVGPVQENAYIVRSDGAAKRARDRRPRR